MKRLLKKSAVLLIALVFGTSLLLSLPMPMAEDGSMSCLFMSGHHMVCPMKALEHLNLWENSFLAAMALGMVLMVAQIFGVRAEKVIANSPRFHQVGWRTLNERNRRLIFHDFLMQSLAQGRLQPKIYDRY
jgi:hypothetical protein